MQFKIRSLTYVRVAVMAFVLLVAAYQVRAKGPTGVAYTKHNLANWSPSGGIPGRKFSSTNVSEVCVFCHTPHAAGAWPLWNKETNTRTNSSGSSLNINQLLIPSAGTGYFHAYSSITTHYNLPTMLGHETILCMSCHDGVSSMAVLHNMPNSLNGAAIQFSGTRDQIGDITENPADIGDANQQINMAFVQGPDGAYDFYQTWGGVMDFGITSGLNTADHPISIDYDSLLPLNPGLRQRAQIHSDIKFFGSGKTQLECATCHDVHVNYNSGSGGDPRYAPFLAYPNSSSALCFQCHIK